MNINYEASGFSELNQRINKCKLDFIGITKKAIMEEADVIMEESKNQVPRDTDALYDSAYIEQLDNGDVELGYGGDHAQINPISGYSVNDYMIAVHERLDVHHDTGKAKFLEDPVNAHKQDIESSLASKIKKLFSFD